MAYKTQNNNQFLAKKIESKSNYNCIWKLNRPPLQYIRVLLTFQLEQILVFDLGKFMNIKNTCDKVRNMKSRRIFIFQREWFIFRLKRISSTVEIQKKTRSIRLNRQPLPSSMSTPRLSSSSINKKEEGGLWQKGRGMELVILNMKNLEL